MVTKILPVAHDPVSRKNIEIRNTPLYMSLCLYIFIPLRHGETGC
jgi:hypothetical protein